MAIQYLCLERTSDHQQNRTSRTESKQARQEGQSTGRHPTRDQASVPAVLLQLRQCKQLEGHRRNRHQ